VIKLTKKAVKQLATFACNQYLIIFFVIAIGLKLYLFNTYVLKVVWPNEQYQYGITFGYLSVAILFLPLLFAKKRKNLIVLIIAALISLLILIDNIYFSYFSSLPTAGLLSSASQASDVGLAISGLIQWWMPLYFVDVVFAAVTLKPVAVLFDRLRGKFNLPSQNIKLSIGLTFIVLAYFCWSICCVGFDKLAEVIDRGYDTVSTSQYYGIIMAHTIDVARFIKEETSHLSTDQEKELSDWVENNKPTQTASLLNGVAKGKNVIMIQVESLGGFALNQKVNGKEVTPNLDKLTSESQYFPNDRFMIGGGHTSDSDFVANTSYFPLTDAATFVLYGRDNFTSLPKVLTSNGYSAYVYHGYNRNFWNRDVALSSLGYQKFYAADNYSKGEKINLGLNDGDFLSETANYIKNQPKPSFSFAITLSSHVPFEITDQTKALGLKTEDYPNQVGGYLENINYTDRMLGKFFDKLKTDGLYNDSLVVVYGDHVPVLSSFTAGTIKYDPNSVQGKEVPLIIKLPNKTTGKIYKNQGTHLDIMPTVLDLMGIKTSSLMFGRSLFVTSNESLKVCTDQLVTFSITGDCKADLKAEKSRAAKIIRYDQFNNIQK